MVGFRYNGPPVLPGSVLDLVVDGPLSSRFSACVRLTDIAWRVGTHSCRSESEYLEWNRLYAEHLSALLGALGVEDADPNTSPDREVIERDMAGPS